MRGGPTARAWDGDRALGERNRKKAVKGYPPRLSGAYLGKHGLSAGWSGGEKKGGGGVDLLETGKLKVGAQKRPWVTDPGIASLGRVCSTWGVDRGGGSQCHCSLASRWFGGFTRGKDKQEVAFDKHTITSSATILTTANKLPGGVSHRTISGSS